MKFKYNSIFWFMFAAAMTYTLIGLISFKLIKSDETMAFSFIDMLFLWFVFTLTKYEDMTISQFVLRVMPWFCLYLTISIAQTLFSDPHDIKNGIQFFIRLFGEGIIIFIFLVTPFLSAIQKKKVQI